MTAKETARTAQESLDLNKLIETEGERLADEVSGIFAESATAKERIPLLAPILGWLSRATEAAVQTANTAQATLDAERADDVPLVTARDKAKRALSSKLVGVRKTLDSVCGEDTVTVLGFSGATPEKEAGLVALGRTLLARIEKHPPKATQGGVSLDVKKLVAGIKEDADTLDTTLNALVKEGREESAALVKRDKALRVARARRVGLARVLQGLYEFVGDAESAARVHVAIGRMTRTETTENPADPSEPSEG